jgi:hypothetical protein
MAEKLKARVLTTPDVQTQVQLAQPRYSGLENLAVKLNQFGRTLGSTAVFLHNKHAKEEEEQGVEDAALAISQGRTTVAELRELGLIGKGQDPFYQDGVFKMIGETKANQYANALEINLSKAGAQEALTTDIFDQVLEQTSKEFLEGDDEIDNPAIQEGFNVRAAQLVERLRNANASLVAKNVEVRGDEELKYHVFSFLSSLGDLSNSQEFFDVGLSGLSRIEDDWFKNTHSGIVSPADKRKFNEAVVQGLISAMWTEDIDPDEAIALSKKLRTGSGTLGLNPDYAEALIRARDEVNIARTNRESQEAARVARERDERQRLKTGEMLVDLIETNDESEFQSVLQRYQREVAENAHLYTREYVTGLAASASGVFNNLFTNFGNEELYNSLYYNLINPASANPLTNQMVADAMMMPNGINVEQASRLYQGMTTRDGRQNSNQERMYRDLSRGLESVINATKQLAVLEGMDKVEYERQVLPVVFQRFDEFATLHPDATYLSQDYVDFKAALSGEVLELLQNITGNSFLRISGGILTKWAEGQEVEATLESTPEWRERLAAQEIAFAIAELNDPEQGVVVFPTTAKVLREFKLNDGGGLDSDKNFVRSVLYAALSKLAEGDGNQQKAIKKAAREYERQKKRHRDPRNSALIEEAERRRANAQGGAEDSDEP